MIYLYDLIWVFIVLFGIVGFFRGAAKELLVSVSVLVALFFTFLLETSLDALKNMNNNEFLCYFRIGLLLFLIIFGYHTPFRAKLPLKENISPNRKIERLLGFTIGALNGFLIFGTIWWYIHQANYPDLVSFFKSPTLGGGIDQTKFNEVLAILPPNWLKPPVLYFLIAISITIVLVMFV